MVDPLSVFTVRDFKVWGEDERVLWARSSLPDAWFRYTEGSLHFLLPVWLPWRQQIPVGVAHYLLVLSLPHTHRGHGNRPV